MVSSVYIDEGMPPVCAFSRTAISPSGRARDSSPGSVSARLSPDAAARGRRGLPVVQDPGMADKDVLGRAGEDRAARYFEERGYSVVARNWRCREGELDLIVEAPGELVVVEVKTRRGDAF